MPSEARIRAIIAVAASMLTAIYYMLRDGTEYRGLGPHHFSQIDRAEVAHGLVGRLRRLGYRVDLQEA